MLPPRAVATAEKSSPSLENFIVLYMTPDRTDVGQKSHAPEALCFLRCRWRELRKLRCSIETRHASNCKRPTDLLENLNFGLCLGSTVGIVPPAVHEGF